VGAPGKRFSHDASVFVFARVFVGLEFCMMLSLSTKMFGLFDEDVILPKYLSPR